MVLLTDALGAQRVHIAPEAFKVSSVEFGDELHFWQGSLPEELSGRLELVSVLFSRTLTAPELREWPLSSLPAQKC